MSRDPWIGTPNAGYWDAFDDDIDEEALKEEQERTRKYLEEWAAKEREEVRRMTERVNALWAAEPYKAAARAKLAKEHPVLVTGAIVGTALAKLFDGSLF